MSADAAVESQPVVAPLTRAAIFLVATVNPGDDSRAAVRAFCGDLAALVPRGGIPRPRRPASPASWAFGSDAWDRLFGAPRPAELHPFREIPRGIAPRGRHARRPALPYPRRAHGSLLRAGDADHGAARRRGRRRSTRCTASAISTSAICWASSTARRTRADEAAIEAALIGDEDAGVRRRQLRHRAEIPARPGRLERAADRDAGAHHRPHQALRCRAGRCGEADARRTTR